MSTAVVLGCLILLTSSAISLDIVADCWSDGVGKRDVLVVDGLPAFLF